jgi:hypothetical protein
MIKNARTIGLSLVFINILILGMVFKPLIASAELSATVAEDKTVELTWSETGSSPYTLFRGDAQIYNGSATSYTDSGLEGGQYTYLLNYQSYELITPGHWVDADYWGIVEEAYTYKEEEWQIVKQAYYKEVTTKIDWCRGTSDSGIVYSHAPPCSDSGNATTKTVKDWELVPAEYGWVEVEYTVDAVYGWIDDEDWVPDQYGYVTKSTTITVNVPAPPEIKQIVTPTVNKVYGGTANSFIPTVKVLDPNGDELTVDYYIDNENQPRESRSISNTATAQTISFTALNIGNLSEGDHTIRFTVNDGSQTDQESIKFYVDKSKPVLGTVSGTSTDTTITLSGSSTDASAGMAADPYRYKVGGVTSSWTDQTTYTRSGLTPNTLYQTAFEAKDKLGLTAIKELSIYTKAQTPTVTIVKTTDASLTLKLNDNNPSTTEYQIKVGSKYLSSNGSLVVNPIWVTAVNKQLAINGLTDNTQYAIQAQARNKEETLTAWSGKVTGTTLAKPPESITTNEAKTSIQLSWPPTSNAMGYDIEVDGIVINRGTATSFTHSNLMIDTRHTYRIRVKNAGGISEWSQLFTVYTLPYPPSTPLNFSVSTLQTEVTLTWDQVVDADSYDIEVDGQIIEGHNYTTYLHSNLLTETTHNYRIRARNRGGVSEWSPSETITTLPFPPDTPTHLRAEVSIYSVNVAWDEMERAEAYEIEVDGFIIDNGLNTSYLHEGLEPLSGHTYRVRGKNIGGKSAWSVPLDITTHPEKPDTPSNIITTSDESSITLIWYEIAHTDLYEIEIDGSRIETVEDTQFTDTGLQSDELHTYRIRAKNISGYSEWSAPVKMETMPVYTGSTPVSLTNVAAIVTNTYITLSWDTVAPDAEYEVEVDGVLYDNGKETIFHHGNLPANEFHIYKIRFKDGSAGENWVAVVSLSTLPDAPDAPSGIEAVATDQSIELRWEKVEGATGYDLEINGETMSLEDAASYLHDELPSGTSYTYRLRAKNMTGVTAWSPSITKSTTNPMYTIDAVKGKAFDLTLLANNVQDFSEMTFVITYDPAQLAIEDLYNYTPEKDRSTGEIAGSSLNVTVSDGKIEIQVKQNIVPGTSWSGEISTIQFKPIVTEQALIEVKVE